MSNPVIVNTLTSEIITFKDVKEITIGRNTASSIDIPSPFISRTQCAIKLNENNEWFLNDLSRHQTTLLNNVPLQGKNRVLKSGDKISFLHYKDGEYTFYSSISDVPNPSKKRKLETQTDFAGDILTPNPADVKNSCQNQISSQNNVIEELQREIALIKEKYDLALEEIDNQRRVNESVSHKLNLLMTESSSTVSSLQNEKESLSNKLKEEEEAKEKMVNQIQELNELLKESELEQIRLNEECKCKELRLDLDKSGKQDDEPKVLNEEKDLNETVTTSEALQKLVEIVEIKWNEQEMEHMREQLKLRDERITDLALEAEKFQAHVLDTLDREMLCSICNDILYEATTLNCRHTFCRVCLFEWKKKKKECPICRTKIKTETRPLVIDSFIDKLAETIGGELKARRMEVKEERASKPMRGGSSSSGRSTPYSRNNRRTRGNFNTISSAMSILQPLVIELSDHFGPAIVPAPIIDLTAASPVTPRQRRRRQPTPYY